MNCAKKLAFRLEKMQFLGGQMVGRIANVCILLILKRQTMCFYFIVNCKVKTWTSLRVFGEVQFVFYFYIFYCQAYIPETQATVAIYTFRNLCVFAYTQKYFSYLKRMTVFRQNSKFIASL